MLFLPFVLLFIHSDIVRADFFPKSFQTKSECIEFITSVAPKLSQAAPEGGSVKLGCLGTGSGVNTTPTGSQKATVL